MTQLLDIFGLLVVILRATALAGESIAIGGIVFSLLALRRVNEPEAWRSVRRLIRWSAAALVISQAAFLAADTLVVQATSGLSLWDVVGAGYFVAGVLSIAGALTLVFWLPKSEPSAWMLAPALAMLTASVATSHAAARVDYRLPAMLLTALHQGATAIWVGGLPHLLLTLRGSRASDAPEIVGSVFSRTAQWSVAVLLAGGIGLGFLYVDSFEGLYATSYGIMVLGKIILLLALLALGGMNFLLVRGVRRNPVSLIARLRRLAEAEIGVGFTVILAAASLTSQPPAIDLLQNRVKPREVVERFTPKAPRLKSPQLNELSPPTPLTSNDSDTVAAYVPGTVTHPNTPGDIAWSEYNHNWAGLVVLAMGILAVASEVFGFRWARHWPLAFLGLSYFLFLRADPEAWPLGPKGFWISMTNSEVLQHRIFAVMIIAFAIFEWGVQNKRIQSNAAKLVFPGVCAVGGALLLTHSHALGNVREEYLAELSHLPIALCAVLAGWSRWLEQRLDGAWKRIPAKVWPACFVIIGLMLFFYREA
jgi:putative copper resistance protein D